MNTKRQASGVGEIRVMTEADLGRVFEIECASYEFPWTLQIFKDCRRVGYHCLVLDDGDDLAGFAILSSAAGEAHVLNLCVDPMQRSSGRGEALLHQLIATAIFSGAKDLFLEVRPSNKTAIALYDRAGFVEIGRRENYYNANTSSGREDAIVMARSLVSFEA